MSKTKSNNAQKKLAAKNSAQNSQDDFENILQEFYVPEEERKAADLPKKKPENTKEKRLKLQAAKAMQQSSQNVQITDSDREKYESLILEINNKFVAIYIPGKIQDGSQQSWHGLSDDQRDIYLRNSLKAVQAGTQKVEEFAERNFARTMQKAVELSQGNIGEIDKVYKKKIQEIYNNELEKIKKMLEIKGLEEHINLIEKYLESRIARFEATILEIKKINLSELITKFSLSFILNYNECTVFNKTQFADFLKRSSDIYSHDWDQLEGKFINIVTNLNKEILSSDNKELLKYLKGLDSLPGVVTQIIMVNPLDKTSMNKLRELPLTPISEIKREEKMVNKKLRSELQYLNNQRNAIYKEVQAFKNAKKTLERYEKLLGYYSGVTDSEFLEEEYDLPEAFLHLRYLTKEKTLNLEVKEEIIEPKLIETRRKKLTDFLQSRNIAENLPTEILNDPNINCEILIGMKRSYNAVENIYISHDDVLRDLLVDKENILNSQEYEILAEACLTQNLRNFFKGQIFSVDEEGIKSTNKMSNQMANLLMHNSDFLTFAKKKNIEKIIKEEAQNCENLSEKNFINGILTRINAGKIIKNLNSSSLKADPKLTSITQLFNVIKKLEPFVQTGNNFLEYDLACANLMNNLGLIAQKQCDTSKNDFLAICKDYRDFVSHGSNNNFAVRIKKYNQEGNLVWEKGLERISQIPDIKERDSELQKFYLERFQEKIFPVQNLNEIIPQEALHSMQSKAVCR